MYKNSKEATNILLVTHHFPPEVNGTATRAYEIVKRLINLNPRVRIFVITPPPVRPFGKFIPQYRLFRKISLFNNKAYVIRVWSYQPTSTNPTTFERIMNYIIFPIISLPIIIGINLICEKVIVITPPSPIHLATIISKIMHKKVIVDVTDLWHEEASYLGYNKIKFLEKLSRGLELSSLKLANLITAATYTIGRFYKNCLDKKEFRVLPTPIDGLSMYCGSSFQEKEYHTVVYAGNFGKPQALHFAIEAFSILSKEDNTIKLLLIGGGEEEEKIRDLVDVLKLNNVEIVPAIPREKLFKHIYKNASIGLVALSFDKALFYALPTKIYEYLACGLPFVSYGSSKELKYLSLTSRAGIHVEDADPLKIANSIQYIIKHRNYFSINAKKYIQNLMLQANKVLVMILSK
jgi:glycosyltransferase involved in cell wall biosynthesis